LRGLPCFFLLKYFAADFFFGVVRSKETFVAKKESIVIIFQKKKEEKFQDLINKFFERLEKFLKSSSFLKDF